MSNIVLDGKNFTDKETFHNLMVKEFNLPGYYGRNLDALWDLLSEESGLNILIMNANKIEENLGDYGKSILRVFDDLSNIEGNKVDYIFSGCYSQELNYKSKSDSNLIKKSLNDNTKISIRKIGENYPNIDASVFIADGARIIGDVELHENSSVWYNAVIRADKNKVIIGANSNIQDNVVIHQSSNSIVSIGKNVTIGHSAIIHGATIEDNVLVGMGVTVLDNAMIGKNTIIGANSLITKGKNIPENSLVMGSPAKVIRKLTEEEVKYIKINADNYFKLSNVHKICK